MTNKIVVALWGALGGLFVVLGAVFHLYVFFAIAGLFLAGTLAMVIPLRAK